MNKQILVVYKSVTGFTKQYAEWIAEKLNCSAVELKKVSAETMSEYKTIIFGGRFHAGFVDGLKNAKALFEKSTAEKLTSIAHARMLFIFCTHSKAFSDFNCSVVSCDCFICSTSLSKRSSACLSTSARYSFNLPLVSSVM